MKRNCPNSTCFSSSSTVKDGRYFRKNDSRWITRYRCQKCGKRFSNSTFQLAYKQKKRRVNFIVYKLLCSGVSMRRIAKIVNIDRKTVKRKLIYLAQKARLSQNQYLAELSQTKLKFIQFDDLITIEHTKLKPLAVSVAIDKKTRSIIGAYVAPIPAFGLLSEKSKRKYGPRQNLHKQALKRLFEKMQSIADPLVIIESDEHKTYPEFVQRYFSQATYKTYKGHPACVVGQGELKKLNKDPLFSINQPLAMLRDNIKRLARRTWCTTKSPDRLQDHLDLYIDFHNRHLI